MTERIDRTAAEPDDIQAAEYVLGTLSADARAVAARRIRDDADFARLVEKWEAHFEPLSDDYEAVPPPARVKTSLDRKLFSEPQSSSQPTQTGLLQSLAFWRFLTAGALACAAAAIVVPRFVEREPVEITVQQPSGLRFVASLRHDDTDVHYFAVYNADDKRIGLNHVSGARPDGHDFVLWVSPDGKPAVQLGVVPVGGTVSISADMAAQLDIGAGTKFTITLEPHERPKANTPSGPVVAIGDLRQI